MEGEGAEGDEEQEEEVLEDEGLGLEDLRVGGRCGGVVGGGCGQGQFLDARPG